MKKRHVVRHTAALAAFALVLAACGGGGTTTNTNTGSPGQVTTGGTYRTALPAFSLSDGFDPTGEYYGVDWSIYSNMLIRTLVTFRHIEGVEGNQPIPDIAESWDTSADQLTWTFHLKSGIMFGPPVSREVTADDILYAFQRINTASLVAQYGNYYDGVIEGMTGTGKIDDPISGITVKDPQTIQFKLTRPTGDLLFRLGMPATGAMPEEVAGCFLKPGEYGRYVISSGPYMFMGQDQLNISSCGSMKPISGFDPEKFMAFVRNPNYDASTDTTEARENNIAGATIVIDTNLDDIFQKIQAGELDGSYGTAPPKTVLQQYSTNPDLKGYLYNNSADRTWYLSMNLLVPPFDDIHVRKAVNWVIDKNALQKAWGGEIQGAIATSVEPPTVLPDTGSYDPYATPDNAGDVSKAMEEMKLSKYDSNGDGSCDSDVCHHVVMTIRNYAPWTDMEPTIVSNLAELGIQIVPRELNPTAMSTAIQTVSNLIPMNAGSGWGKDYPDPYGFDYFIFDSAGIICSGSNNYANLGFTKDLAAECDVQDAYNTATDNGKNPIPSIDDKIDNECFVLAGAERSSCFADMDHFIMEDAVPWVPYLWATVINITGPTVTKFEYDQWAGTLSWSKIAVNNDINPEDVPLV